LLTNFQLLSQFPSIVFITHTHSDHIHMLTHLKSRRTKPDIYLPYETAEAVEEFMTRAQYMTDNFVRTAEQPLEPAYTLKPVKPNEIIKIKRGNDDFLVEIVECVHRVPCVGYLFYSMGQKLKPEYKSLSGKEIGVLRKSGVDIYAIIKKPLFAFMGDTHAQVFENNPQILDMPIVITECTFLEEDEKENALRTGHTLFSQLLPFLLAHPKTLFILIHFSLRYRIAQIHSFFEQKKLQHKLNNIIVWLPSKSEPS